MPHRTLPLYHQRQAVLLGPDEPAPYGGTEAEVIKSWWDERRGWCYQLRCFNGQTTDAQENLHIAGPAKEGTE